MGKVLFHSLAQRFSSLQDNYNKSGRRVINGAQRTATSQWQSRIFRNANPVAAATTPYTAQYVQYSFLYHE